MHRNTAILLSLITITSFFLGFIICFFCPFEEHIRFDEILLRNTPNHISLHQQQDPLMEKPDMFFTISGRVNGNPFPNSTVSIYAVSDTSRATVLATIRNSTPLLNTSINTTNGFNFRCISPGHYATVIPDTSFDGPIGAALPNKWRHNGYALNISLHGYDHTYLVVAFSIMNVLEHIP